MKKLYIPPTLILYCLLAMIALSIFVSQYNYMKFPFNMGGLLIAFSGLMLMRKAKSLFSKHATTLKIRESSHLINESVFSITRNPMYMGMSILIFGFSIVSMNVIALCLPFVFLLLIRILFIRKEEKLMCDVFGEEYLDYKKSVRRWI